MFTPKDSFTGEEQVQRTHWLWEHRQTICMIIWKGGTFAVFLFTAIGFASFITEEAIQSRSFGLFPLISNDMWEEARAYLVISEPKFRRDFRYLRKLCRINLISGTAFRCFVEAEESKLEINKQLITHKLAEIRKEQRLNPYTTTLTW